MSVYEARRWDALEKHWSKKASRRELMPAKVRAAGEKTRAVAVRTGAAVAEATPESVREFGVKAVDAALMPVVEGIVHLIELANDWAVELTDPEKVLEFHREQSRDVMSLADLRELELAEADEVVRRLGSQMAIVRSRGGRRPGRPGDGSGHGRSRGHHC
jgi:hypothetical protein